MKDRTLKLDVAGVGTVSVKMKKQNKNMYLRILTDGTISVTMPLYMPLEEAVRFVKKHQSRIQEKQKIKTAVYCENTDFRTRTRKLKITRTGSRPGAGLKPGVLELCIPAEAELLSKKVQDAIRALLYAALKKEAEEYIPGRVKELAEKWKLKFTKVSIRKTRSIWGSCSSKNALSFTSAIILLPDRLIDAVIAHELTHTKIRNHSRHFYSKLAEICPEAVKLRKELKNYSITL